MQAVQRVRAGCDDRIAGRGRVGAHGGWILDRGEVVADTGDDVVGDGDFTVWRVCISASSREAKRRKRRALAYIALSRAMHLARQE